MIVFVDKHCFILYFILHNTGPHFLSHHGQQTGIHGLYAQRCNAGPTSYCSGTMRMAGQPLPSAAGAFQPAKPGQIFLN